MANVAVFEDQIVEEQDHDDTGQGDEDDWIMDLPTNTILKGMVVLEHIFESDPQG